MRKANKVLQNILASIKNGRGDETDFYLYEYFKYLTEEYNYNLIHNKIYSRKTDLDYDLDCKILHILTKGFNYRLKRMVPHVKYGYRLPDQLKDALNSGLLRYVSNPLLVSDILGYLHCYVFGLSYASNERCVTAKEFLKLESMLEKYQVIVKKASVN